MVGPAQLKGLTDTDILIDGSRGVPAAIDWVGMEIASGMLTTSTVTAMELIQGCRDNTGLNQVRQLLARVTVLPVDGDISQQALQLMDTYFLSHGLLIADAFIAATAPVHGLTLYTRNVRDFRMIPGLAVVRPY
jgi:predicted nucleic acid-binding protein